MTDPGTDPPAATVLDGPDAVQAAVGSHLGFSDWLEMDQGRVNLFADATGDHQWIHVDPERAKSGPFGAPVAHGYLTLSLSNWFLPQIVEFTGFSAGGELRRRQGAVHRSREGRRPGAGWGRAGGGDRREGWGCRPSCGSPSRSTGRPKPACGDRLPEPLARLSAGRARHPPTSHRVPALTAAARAVMVDPMVQNSDRLLLT